MIVDKRAHLDLNPHFGKEIQAQRVNYPWFITGHVKEPKGLESKSAEGSRQNGWDAHKCSRMLYTCAVIYIQYTLSPVHQSNLSQTVIIFLLQCCFDGSPATQMTSSLILTLLVLF